MINLDSHILILALIGDLTTREKRLLSHNTWSISSVVLWEIARWQQRGRIELDLTDRELREVFAPVHVWPLDLETALVSTRLDFKGDPVDHIVAATSVVNEVPLLTRDKAILTSKLVPLA